MQTKYDATLKLLERRGATNSKEQFTVFVAQVILLIVYVSDKNANNLLELAIALLLTVLTHVAFKILKNLLVLVGLVGLILNDGEENPLL